MKITLISLFKILRMFSKFGKKGNFTFQAKVTIFKNLIISKVNHLALVTNVPRVIIDPLNKIQRESIWKRKHPKIRNSSFYNTYENGSLKSADIPNS